MHEPQHSLDHHESGEGEEQGRLDQRRKRLDFAVAVIVFGIRRLDGDAHRLKGDEGHPCIYEIVAGLRQQCKRARRGALRRIWRS